MISYLRISLTWRFPRYWTCKEHSISSIQNNCSKRTVLSSSTPSFSTEDLHVKQNDMETVCVLYKHCVLDRGSNWNTVNKLSSAQLSHSILMLLYLNGTLSLLYIHNMQHKHTKHTGRYIPIVAVWRKDLVCCQGDLIGYCKWMPVIDMGNSIQTENSEINWQ